MSAADRPGGEYRKAQPEGSADSAPSSTPPVADDTACLTPESPPVAAAEARAEAPARVSSIEAIARSRLQAVSAQSLLVDVAARLSNAQISVAVVCGADGAPLGVITETVLVRRLGLGQADFFTTQAADVMTRDITVCARDEVLSDVLAMMHRRGLIHVLLVDADNRALGVINARDGLRALLAAGNYEEELLRNYVMGIGYQ